MKILFSTNSWLYDVMVRSFPIWKDKGVDVVYDLLLLSHLTYIKRYLSECPVDYSVYTNSIYERWDYVDITDENILRIEKKYQIILNEMIIYDIAMTKYEAIPPQKIKNEVYWRKVFVATFDYYEKLLEKHKPDYIFGEGPHGLGMKILFEVSKKMNIPFFAIYGSYFQNNTVFAYGRTGKNVMLERYFEDPSFLNDYDYEKGKEFIHMVKYKNEIPYYQKNFNNQKLKILPSNFKLAIEAITKLIKIYRLGRLKSTLDCRFNPFWGPIVCRFKVYEKFRYISKQAVVPNFKEDYVVYFNHFQPEATTSVVSPYYENQSNLIENIAKSLSGTLKLYIKEHTTKLGNRGREFYNSLFNYPSVKLITPFANSFDLIKNSRMVFTISGTVGMETIIMGKPVGVFSDCYYSFYPGVKRIKEPEQIKGVVNWGLYEFRKDDAMIERFAAAYCKSLYPTFISDEPDERKKLLVKGDDLKKFVQGILNFIDDIEKFSIKIN